MVIAAAGPSLADEDLEHVRRVRARGGARLIVINRSWERAPWADLLYACDGNWWRTSQPDFAGIRVTQDERAVKFGALFVPAIEAEGISLDPAVIHLGGNSGLQALNLAVHLAAPSPIYLTGFDMQTDSNGRMHWHEDHPPGLCNPTPGRLAAWARAFAAAAADLARAGARVVNCSRETALDCFPRARLEDVL